MLGIQSLSFTQGPRSGFSSGGGLTRTRKREPTRGVWGHAPPGKFEINYYSSEMARNASKKR